MEENWLRWLPHPDIRGNIYLKKTTISDNQFLIYGELLSRKSQQVIKYKYIKMDYTDSILSYRDTDEGKRLETVNSLSTKYGDEFYGPWDFFIVENSKYIKWFLNECLDETPNVNFEHHVLFTDPVIDILSIKKPEVTLSNSPIL